jgi:hypothetical protein
MSDTPRVDELLQRLQSLEEEKRRWKRIALITLTVLLLGVAGGILVSTGTAEVYWRMVQRQEERQRELEEAQQRAVQEAEVTRIIAEQRLREAEQMRQAQLARALQQLQQQKQPQEP